MEYNIYCVRDEKMTSTLYGAIMLQESDDVAIRGFAAECNKPESLWYQYPGDFSLWCVGTYYMATGEIISEIRKVADAAQLVKKEI